MRPSHIIETILHASFFFQAEISQRLRAQTFFLTINLAKKILDTYYFLMRMWECIRKFFFVMMVIAFERKWNNIAKIK
jgi:hypothetical protein